MARRWAREHTPHLAVMCTRGCAHQCRTWCVPAGLPERRTRMLIRGARTRHARTWQTLVTNEDVNAGRVPELTTHIDQPPQSWLRHGETRQLPQRDEELAISCDARAGPHHCTGDLEGCRHPNAATGPKYRSSRIDGRCPERVALAVYSGAGVLPPLGEYTWRCDPAGCWRRPPAARGGLASPN
jgi:hypothetical protein